MHKRDSKSFDTGSLQSRCQIDELDSNVVENRFLAAAATHQSCDDGLFNDRNKMSAADTSQRNDISETSNNRQDDDAKNTEPEQQNEVITSTTSIQYRTYYICINAWMNI